MAIDTVRGTQLLIKVGDGAAPAENFAHPCLINAKRGLKFQSSANKIVIPDCDNPDDPAWNQVILDALSAMIDGAGKLDAAAVPAYDAWFRGGVSKNVQVWLGNKGYWQGGFKLTSWDITGDRGAFCEVTLTIESDGVLQPWIDAGA
jgi:hypothetical protein